MDSNESGKEVKTSNSVEGLIGEGMYLEAIALNNTDMSYYQKLFICFLERLDIDVKNLPVDTWSNEYEFISELMELISSCEKEFKDAYVRLKYMDKKVDSLLFKGLFNNEKDMLTLSRLIIICNTKDSNELENKLDRLNEGEEESQALLQNYLENKLYGKFAETSIVIATKYINNYGKYVNTISKDEAESGEGFRGISSDFRVKD